MHLKATSGVLGRRVHTLFRCSDNCSRQPFGVSRHQSSNTAAMADGSGGGGGCAPPTTVELLAAFKTSEEHSRFSSTFKLAEGTTGVVLHMPAESPAAAHNSWLDSSTVFSHLQTQHMGRVLLSTPSIPSTQEFMRQHTNVLPDGTVLAADQQTQGKGRGGNVWTSPAGCLMFTALRQLQVTGTQAPFINYVVCLAVVQGIKEATRHVIEGGLDVQIKWPNDIYYNGVKIGGALIHTTWAASSQQFCVLTGIGLNVSNSQPTTCLDDIIRSRRQQQHAQQAQQQAQQPMGQPEQHGLHLRVCKEQLLASVLNHLESCFDTFQAHGFDPLRALYLFSWMHSNQVVELVEEGAAAAGGGAKRVPLTIVGLSPHGFLLAKDPLGQDYELTPDGNSLDMMQGLIKKKLH